MILYDLQDSRHAHFSPNSWRTRMALAHKQLAYEVRPVRFVDIGSIAHGRVKTIPAIQDGDQVVYDSWAIAEHLDRRDPDAPRLIPDGTGARLMQFFQSWVQTTMHAGIANLILLDVWRQLAPEDQHYFRTTREKTYGQTLEQLQAGRDARIEPFRRALAPLRLAVTHAAFVGGQAPCYADYLAFGALQWARISSPVALLASDDPVSAWFERCLDLHGGIGRAEPSYADHQRAQPPSP